MMKDGRCLFSAIGASKLSITELRKWSAYKRNAGNYPIKNGPARHSDVDRMAWELQLAKDTVKPWVEYLKTKGRHVEAEEAENGTIHREGPLIMQEISEALQVRIILHYKFTTQARFRKKYQVLPAPNRQIV